MNRMFVLLFASTLSVAAHAERFVIAHPSVSMTDSGTVLTLGITEGRSSFSLNHADPLQLNLACGQPNQKGTSLLAVTVNGEIKIVGRKKDCVATLAKIAATPARFSLTVDMTADEVERAVPGFEYEIVATAQ